MQRGERTRSAIVRLGADIASAEGLEGLTIGRMARDMHMSKSGLIGHFSSKTNLQLAIVDFARDLFVAEIMTPNQDVRSGLLRLQALLEAWLSYIERAVFRGGCFFWAASAEFDDRPGPVRERIAGLTSEWLYKLEFEIGEAIEKGQMVPDTDAVQMAFEVHAMVQQANWASRLLEDASAFGKARQAIRVRLASGVTPKGKALLRKETRE